MFFRKNRENRSYERIDFFQSSYFLVEGEPQEQATNECWFTNISLGGVAFQAALEPQNADTTIRVLYRLGQHYRNDSMQVRFVRKLMSQWQYGCQFVDDDEARTDQIAEYIRKKKEG